MLENTTVTKKELEVAYLFSSFVDFLRINKRPETRV